MFFFFLNSLNSRSLHVVETVLWGWRCFESSKIGLPVNIFLCFKFLFASKWLLKNAAPPFPTLFCTVYWLIRRTIFPTVVSQEASLPFLSHCCCFYNFLICLLPVIRLLYPVLHSVSLPLVYVDNEGRMNGILRWFLGSIVPYHFFF